MATLAHVGYVLEREVSAGRIYWSQPTDRLRGLIESRRPYWFHARGAGNNEDVDTLVACAQTLVYGCRISWEEHSDLTALCPGIVERAASLGLRGGNSPHFVEVADAARYLLSGGEWHRDPRDLARAIRVYRMLPATATHIRDRIAASAAATCAVEEALRLAGQDPIPLDESALVALGLVVDWLSRRDHALKEKRLAAICEQSLEAARSLSRLPSVLHRPFGLAASTRDFVAAEEVVRRLPSRPLRAMEQVLQVEARLKGLSA